jgi:hypothetical protein
MRRFLAIGCWVALVVPAAWGQDQEKPHVSKAGHASSSGGSSTGSYDMVMLLAMPEVHQELGLDDKKKKEVEELIEKTQEEMKTWLNPASLQGLSGEEAKKKMDELTSKGNELNKKTVDRLGKILDPKGFDRFQELRYQYRGAAALGWPEVSDKLKLSPEQQQRIRELTNGCPSHLRAPPEIEERILATLNPGQKEAWEKMLGKKFDFQATGGPFSGFGALRGSGPADAGRQPSEEKKPDPKK